MKFEDLTIAEAERIFTDDTAARKFEREVLYSGPSQLTPEDLEAIERIVNKYCRKNESIKERFRLFIEHRRVQILEDVSEYRLAAARRGRPRSDEKSTEEFEDVTFVFEADKQHGEPARWRAELTVPAVATAETMLPIKINAEGIFKIAGIALPIVNGLAELPLGVFLAGMREPKVELTTVDGKVLSGGLVFF